MLGYYHKKILEFLYELSKQDKYYSDRELSKKIRINNERVTSKTIRRWFDLLESTCFDYHPYIYIERLGLELFYAFYNEDKGIIISPYTSYLNKSIDLRNMRNIVTHSFWVPQGYESLMKIIPKIEKFYSKEVIVNPLHKMFDDKGNIYPLKDLSEEQENNIRRVINSLKNIHEQEIRGEIKRNPLIIPIIFEYDKEHWSSIEVWNSLKKKRDIWKYFRKIKKKSDYVAIKHIQLTIKKISDMGLIKFMNINYAPLEERNHYVWICSKINRNLKKILEELSLLAPFIYIYRAKEKDKYLFNLMIPNYLLDKVLNIFMDNAIILNVYLVNYEKSRPLWNREWLKFNYEKAFDPEKGEWLKVKKEKIIIKNS